MWMEAAQRNTAHVSDLFSKSKIHELVASSSMEQDARLQSASYTKAASITKMTPKSRRNENVCPTGISEAGGETDLWAVDVNTAGHATSSSNKDVHSAHFRPAFRPPRSYMPVKRWTEFHLHIDVRRCYCRQNMHGLVTFLREAA
jgi:hypothetical protein